VLVYGHKLDYGGFPVAAMIGDINPNYTTNCCSKIVLQGYCPSATRYAKAFTSFHKEPYELDFKKDVKLVALSCTRVS
jgi:hypothetical protein